MTLQDVDAASEAQPGAAAAPAAATYSGVAIALHWIIALAILGQIALGWQLHRVAEGPARYAAFQLHKSIGISILLLSLARVGWRLVHPAPPQVALPRGQRLASQFVHSGLYAIMIGLPLTGWIMVSTSRLPIPTRLYGVVPWPAIPGLAAQSPEMKAGWNSIGEGGHSLLVYVTLAMLVLHFGAVMKHQLVDRDRVFARMAPGAAPGWREPRLWGALALALAAMLLGSTLVAGSGEHRHGDEQAAVRAAPAPAISSAPPARGSISPAATVTPAALPAKVGAGPARWSVKKGQLRFATTWAGAPVAGDFSRWTSDIMFSPDALDQSSLVVRIDLASASTGDSQRDAALPTADWFDTATHPSGTFRSKRIRSTGAHRYVAAGMLDLRGIRHNIEVPFTVRIKSNTAVARGAFTVDRTIFGVGQGEWAATDQIPAGVAVTFAITAKAAVAE